MKTYPSPLQWFSEDITTSSYQRSLTPHEHSVISSTMARMSEPQLSPTIEKNTLESLYTDVMNALLHKQGFIVLKGLPTYHDSYSVDCIKNFLVQFCLNLGTPLRQNKNNDVIFDVKSIEGKQLSNLNSRGPYVKDELPMHTDAGAILGMYCLAAADNGGHTLLASAKTVHDEIEKTRPDLLKVLYEPFYLDRRGQELEGSLPYDISPIFARYGEDIMCQFHEPFYSDAQKKFPEIPRWSHEQHEAIQLFNQISKRTDIAFETKLEPGSIIFINNEKILHGRSAFNFTENQSLRYLLRIWLNTPLIENTFPSFFGYDAQSRPVLN